MPLSPSRHARAPAEARVDPSILKLTKLHYVEAPAIQVRMSGSNVVKPKNVSTLSTYSLNMRIQIETIFFEAV